MSTNVAVALRCVPFVAPGAIAQLPEPSAVVDPRSTAPSPEPDGSQAGLAKTSIESSGSAVPSMLVELATAMVGGVTNPPPTPSASTSMPRPPLSWMLFPRTDTEPEATTWTPSPSFQAMTLASEGSVPPTITSKESSIAMPMPFPRSAAPSVPMRLPRRIAPSEPLTRMPAPSKLTIWRPMTVPNPSGLAITRPSAEAVAVPSRTTPGAPLMSSALASIVIASSAGGRADESAIVWGPDAGDVEVDRVGSGCRIGVEDRLAQRSGAGVGRARDSERCGARGLRRQREDAGQGDDGGDERDDRAGNRPLSGRGGTGLGMPDQVGPLRGSGSRAGHTGGRRVAG